MLASHASEVWLDPLGGAMVAGPGGGQLYFGELLERLNVNARVYQRGHLQKRGGALLPRLDVRARA